MLNRCDSCHELFEDIEVFDGMRLCPECLENMSNGVIDAPSGLDDLDELELYGEDARDAMLMEVAEIKREMGTM